VSIHALSWAFKRDIKRSSEKFVLVCLCNYADERGYCYPSIAALQRDTSQDRKTVIANLKALIESRYIADTGRRVGPTKGVIVYQVLGFASSAEIGTSTEIGTVPVLPGSSTEIPTKQSRFSVEGVPKTGHRSVREPSEEPSENRQGRATRLPTDFELTAERRLVAEAERLPAERTFAKFCDHWKAASGAKARKHDWDATWRNWCRTEVDRIKPGFAVAGTRTTTRKLKTADEIEAEERARGDWDAKH
jgi:hypothetical protein